MISIRKLIYKGLKSPCNWEQEILLDLIYGFKVSMYSTHCAKTSTRVSEIIKRGVFVHKEVKQKVSKHGNNINYMEYSIPAKELKIAVKVYKQITCNDKR